MTNGQKLAKASTSKIQKCKKWIRLEKMSKTDPPPQINQKQKWPKGNQNSQKLQQKLQEAAKSTPKQPRNG